MDIDVTKENIQPLRGGRNVQQLGMALQAQTNRELQLELLQQKEAFEELIRNYEGDDPLENFYNYILWIEQSYPKHGHEGNLIPLLEHCLGLFENDKRYTHDRRFCKLWIKYFDLLPNPLELYHMMKAKGLCTGCADFYKAWAYYFEAAGEFQHANSVFEEGKRNLAQPFDELENAHKNLIMAAGQHVLYGPDENRLIEKRRALTSLETYKPGRVASVRVPSSNGLVTLPSSNNLVPKSNPMIQVYEGNSVMGAEAPPLSLITVAKSQEVPKENTMKPGPWTTVPVKKRVLTGKSTLGFVVHEDEEDNRFSRNFPKECYEDYSDWRVLIKYPEPPNPAMIPMYPKHRVYIDPNTEYSLEELRATRYRGRVSYVPTQQMTSAVMLENVESMQESLTELKNDLVQLSNESHHSDVFRPNQTSYMQSSSMQVPISNHEILQNAVQQPFGDSAKFVQEPSKSDRNLFNWNNSPAVATKFRIWDGSPQKDFEIFSESLEEIQPPVLPKAFPSFFAGSAMKTVNPAFNDLNADDLAETGSRGGMDVAATAQATDSAKPMPIFSDNSSSSFEDVYQEDKELDNSCNTNMFLNNLNAMQVSTPNKRQAMSVNDNEEVVNVQKTLFAEPQLSTIFEETKSYGSGSSSSGVTTKSSLFNNNTNKIGTILEEHNSYLAQNMMANAALRSSLLGNLVDLPTSPVVSQTSAAKPYFTICEDEVPSPIDNSPPGSPLRLPPHPVDVTPLDYCPSDPFKPSVVNQLLERISFPGPHNYGYFEVASMPRICLKKEPLIVGKDRYVVEKQLGKGTFGTVYKALDLRRNTTVALKFQKPPNRWEFYVCREIQSRLVSHPLRDRFMNVTFGYFSDQGSILISEFKSAGSLLDLANLHKQKAGKLKECLVIYFCLQMLEIVQALHDIKIIHADIKPDNFLVFLSPDNTICLQLIDFGCSIDMSLFPPNAIFTRRIQTEDFVCCEMMDGRPWNYHTDMFCIAATAHVLLFDTYIKMQKNRDGNWSLSTSPPRYYRRILWTAFFHELLNQKNGPANSSALQVRLKEELSRLDRDSSTSLSTQMRHVVNLLKNR